MPTKNVRAWTGVIALLAMPNTWAANGLNLIGFGTESSTMAGADIAVARDSLALNTNPAGLSQIPDRQLDLYAGAAVFHVSHGDQLQDHETSDSNVRAAGQFGYAWKPANEAVRYGIGIFAQAGAGADFGALRTAFGTVDRASLQVAAVKLQAGVSLQLNDQLSIGAALAVVRAELEQEFFPDTSFFNPMNPAQAFFGAEQKGMEALAPGFKLGVMYQVSQNIQIGAAYTSKFKLEFEDGTFISNMSALNPLLGKVRYREARFEGLNLPQEFGVGAAWQASDALLLAAEVTHINWSDAVKQTRLTARNPDNPGAPAVIRQQTTLNWRDQIVYAIGAVYTLNSRFLLRAGYNHASNPVPDQNLSPLLGPIGEDHVTFGMGYQVNKQWSIDGGVEVQLENNATYTNPDLPFGPDAKLENRIYLLHMQISRRW